VGVVFQYTEMGALLNLPRIYAVYDAASNRTYEDPGYYISGRDAENYIGAVVPGGIYDTLAVAKRRADTVVRDDTLAAAERRADTVVREAPVEGDRPAESGSGSENDLAPVIAPPATVSEEESKFWQKPWFLATVGTVVVSGVGYGIWRYTRAKRGT
jgi:hypothetical protein